MLKELELERIEQNGLVYYQHPQWQQQIKHGVFTRHGGVSQSYWSSLNVGGTNGDDEQAVYENHQRMYKSIDVNAERAVTTWLVHGVDTIVVDEPHPDRRWLAKADGMITNKPNTPLVMRYGDCVPLLVYDPVQEVIALGHAGWRGTVSGMGKSLIDAMKATYGCRPHDIEVVIGPSISQQNYQIGEEVVEETLAYYGQNSELIWRDPSDGTAYLDLWKSNQLDFEQQGVSKISVMGICTYDNVQDFFSHRAEDGKTGRFGVVMSL